MTAKIDSDFQTKSLCEIARDLDNLPSDFTLSGSNLTIPEIVAVARRNAQVELSHDPSIIDRIEDCYRHMMKNIREGVPIYGSNTGYGARASQVLTSGTEEDRLDLARQISERITHVDISVGPTFSKEIVRAAMAIRINMLMRGVSAIKLSDLEIYQRMLNQNITPIVNQYGGIGASGDLAHNCRVLNAARQLDGVMVEDGQGRVQPAKIALSGVGIPALQLDPKAGLGFVNGDNFSTAVATLLTVDTLNLLLLSCVVGAMVVEVLKGSNRSFHPVVDAFRPHPGQAEAAGLFRYLLNGSKLAFQEMQGHQLREPGVKVQDGYSLRGLSQYYGVNFEKVKWALGVITINANSVSDNPLWVPPDYVTEGEAPWQWVSGGNFLATNMVDVMDNLRKVMTQIVKLNDRHLARLVDPHESNGLPANLSDGTALTQCTFKGVQIQSGMFEVYSTLLSMPVSTMFGVHEEGNQDITSHALTSGILGLENLRLVQYSLAQNLLAVAQAVDLRGGAEKLSSHTRPVYRFIRGSTSYVKEERPLAGEIEAIYSKMKNGELFSLINNEVMRDLN